MTIWHLFQERLLKHKNTQLMYIQQIYDL